MTEEQRTLIILNPKAGSGRAGKIWSEIEPLLWDELGELVVAITQHPEEVALHLDKARDVGLTRVVAIGGDGTNHAIVNAIQDLHQKDPSAPEMTFAQLPIGTGRDFARTLGTPFDPKEAVHWIAHASPRPIDIGQIDIDDKESHHFLNIASGGLSGKVAKNVNNLKHRWTLTFHLASLRGLIGFSPPRMKLTLDGEEWYDDKAWTFVVANGRMFGHGMLVAPYAEIDDGLFDVLVVESMPRWQAALALNSIYSGKHINRSDVHYKQAREVIVESPHQRLPLELDGETSAGEHLKFTVREGALNMLLGA